MTFSPILLRDLQICLLICHLTPMFYQILFSSNCHSCSSKDPCLKLLLLNLLTIRVSMMNYLCKGLFCSCLEGRRALCWHLRTICCYISCPCCPRELDIFLGFLKDHPPTRWVDSGFRRVWVFCWNTTFMSQSSNPSWHFYFREKQAWVLAPGFTVLNYWRSRCLWPNWSPALDSSYLEVDLRLALSLF